MKRLFIYLFDDVEGGILGTAFAGGFIGGMIETGFTQGNPSGLGVLVGALLGIAFLIVYSKREAESSRRGE